MSQQLLEVILLVMDMGARTRYWIRFPQVFPFCVSWEDAVFYLHNSIVVASTKISPVLPPSRPPSMLSAYKTVTAGYPHGPPTIEAG